MDIKNLKPKVLDCPNCGQHTFKRSLVSSKVDDMPVSFVYYICSNCREYKDVYDENGAIIDSAIELSQLISNLQTSVLKNIM